MLGRSEALGGEKRRQLGQTPTGLSSDGRWRHARLGCFRSSFSLDRYIVWISWLLDYLSAIAGCSLTEKLNQTNDEKTPSQNLDSSL
jgi:hypothetical protein